MRRRRLGSGSRWLAILFFAVVAPPAITLMWLGWQLLQQDQVSWAQRELELRQAAAAIAAGSLAQSLKDVERDVQDGRTPDHVVRFTASPRGLQAFPPDRVLWLPVVATLPPAATHEFADAELQEFQGERARALRRYSSLARSSVPAIRAGGLVREARVHRREGRHEAALSAYRQLAAIENVAVDGLPADLVARRAIGFLLEESGRTEELDREVTALEADLRAGRWMLDRSAWHLTAGQIETWVGRAVQTSKQATTLTAVGEALWQEWQRDQVQPISASSTRVIVVEGTPVTVLLRANADEMTAIALLPALLETWLQALPATGATAAGRVSLVTDAGQPIAGPRAVTGSAAVKLVAADTRLPWTLVVSPPEIPQQAEEFTRRRQLLTAGLVAIVLLLAGGSYVLWRVVRRELIVARLQTNFVSAVSHEFRTPLASLRHVTELLDEDDELPRARRRSFYAVLGRNTDRLQRLVESLLDFARMEDGRKPYDRRPLNISDLTGQVVADFRGEARADGFRIDFMVNEAQDLEMPGDAAALTNAVWNLLDNAVKYSPDRQPIRVSVDRHPMGVAISVSDRGLGIPRREQKDIFERFVRGEQATRLGIKGTGLGLAMVTHIVTAHGGRVEVESEEGGGSTFRVLLPALRKAPSQTASRADIHRSEIDLTSEI